MVYIDMSAKGVFQDQVVIITGASSGIGRASARLFADLHARVVLASRNMEKLTSLRDEIQAHAGLALAIEADVSNFEDTQRIARETISTWGRIDILIACAGKYVRDSSHQIDIQLVEESMSVNFYGALNIIKSVLPEMKNRGKGHIVIVNSLDAKKGIVGDAPYVAAKAALDGFGDVLRQEQRDSHIRVTTIYPGRVDTPMIQDIKVPWSTPKIPPAKVAKAIVNGIRRNRAFVFIPSVYRPLAGFNTLAPRFFDWSYKIMGIEGTKKDSDTAPHPPVRNSD